MSIAPYPTFLTAGSPRFTAFIAAGLLTLLGGIAVVHEPRVVFVAVAFLVVVGAWIAAARWRTVPLLFVLGMNAAAAMIWLPPIQGTVGRRDNLEVYGVMVGAAVGLALVLSLTRMPADSGLRLSFRNLNITGKVALTLVPAIALIGVAAGLSHGNSLSLLLGDTSRLLLIPMVYVITLLSLSNRADMRVIVFALGTFVLIQQSREAIPGFVFLQDNEATRIHSILWIENLIGVFAFVFLASESRSVIARFALVLAATILVAIGLLSGFRTYVLILSMAPLLLLLMNPSFCWRLVKRTALPLGISVALVGITTVFVPATGAVFQKVSSSLQGRLEITTSGDEDVSLKHRYWEIETVTKSLSDPAVFLLGNGAGATYSLIGSPSAYALSRYEAAGLEAHHIHNVLASMAFRMGVVGLVLFPLLVTPSLREGFIITRRAGRGGLEGFALMSLISICGAAIMFSYVVGDLFFPIILGLIGANKQLNSGVAEGRE